MTITITQEQIEELKVIGKIEIEVVQKKDDSVLVFIKKMMESLEPEFTYPMWFKNNTSDTVVRFDSLTSGEVIVGGIVKDEYTRYIFQKGKKYTILTPHTDKKIWTQIEEPKQKWEPKPEFLEKAYEIVKPNLNLTAYVLEFDDGWEADWSNRGQPKAYIYFNLRNNYFEVGNNYDCKDTGVYMSESCAKGLVEKLNNGEVEL